MYGTNSPLESLAAFAIVFATGVITTIGLAKYVEKVKRDAHEAAEPGSQMAG